TVVRSPSRTACLSCSTSYLRNRPADGLCPASHARSGCAPRRPARDGRRWQAGRSRRPPDEPAMDAPRYEDLTALLVNCSLTPDPARSHTGRLLDVVDHLMTGAGVTVDRLHAVGHDIAPGVQPDMREHGWERDEWPELWPRVQAADILVLGTPLWLGEESSVCRRVVERLYAMSGQLNDAGQSIYYGKVGGAVITGNEDGVKHTAMSLLFALSHLGLTIPPQADVGWLGEIGPGPSY